MSTVTKAALEQLLDKTRKEVDDAVRENKVLRNKVAELASKLYVAEERLFYYRGHLSYFMPALVETELSSGIEEV